MGGGIDGVGGGGDDDGGASGEGNRGLGGNGLGEGGDGKHALRPVQVVFFQGTLTLQAEVRASSRKHEVLSGQPEVGAPRASENAHLAVLLSS